MTILQTMNCGQMILCFDLQGTDWSPDVFWNSWWQWMTKISGIEPVHTKTRCWPQNFIQHIKSDASGGSLLYIWTQLLYIWNDL